MCHSKRLHPCLLSATRLPQLERSWVNPFFKVAPTKQVGMCQEELEDSLQPLQKADALQSVKLHTLCFANVWNLHVGTIHLVCIHAQRYAVISFRFINNGDIILHTGGGGGQKRPIFCVRTKWMVPIDNNT